MELKQTIVLTGFMGSGKTAVGRMLAACIDKPFRDLDKVIEDGERRTISDIFKTEGEALFRTLERQYLEQVLKFQPLVLALGGGALQQQAVIRLVQQNGIMVYLNVPQEVLVQRLIGDKNRPLLRNAEGKFLDEPELRKRVCSMLNEREPLYRQADVTLNIEYHWTVRKTTNELIKILSTHAPAAIS